MNKIRSVIGIVMILIAVGSLFFWESYGREKFLSKEVICTKIDIKRGQVINPGMLKVGNVLPDNAVKGHMKIIETKELVGKVAKFDIPANCQLTNTMVAVKEKFWGKDKSIYVIPREWIAMRSSSLRRGDKIDIYSINPAYKLGTFYIAFVKDDVDREIVDIEGKENDLLKRFSTSGVINHVEIICDKQSYERIRQASQGAENNLLIVQGGTL